MNTARGSNTPFNNVTMGAFHGGQIVGVYGANASQVTGANAGKLSHTGWHIVRRGTGPLASLTITSGGTGYSNTDTFRVAVSGTGSTNAVGTVLTNGSGVITALTITNAGKGFSNAASGTFALLASGGGASAGSGATIGVTYGGRANRMHYECVVAGSITGSPPNTLP
jgi:hypothetical protein